MKTEQLWPFEVSKQALLRAHNLVMVVLPMCLFLLAALIPLVLPVFPPGSNQTYVRIYSYGSLWTKVPVFPRTALPGHDIGWTVAKYGSVIIALFYALQLGIRTGLFWRCRLLSEEFRVTPQRAELVLFASLHRRVISAFTLAAIIAIPWCALALLLRFDEAVLLERSGLRGANIELFIRLDIAGHYLAFGFWEWLAMEGAVLGVYGGALLMSARLVPWKPVLPMLAIGVAGMFWWQLHGALPLLIYAFAWWMVKERFSSKDT